ncbi:hypothetical protein BKA63DRAFT_502132 [Paraphoma chrysanthemicola]|nr:hypothetical protein BKA63DRAFT_502132 [Paraphoma chrysanthemicola]
MYLSLRFRCWNCKLPPNYTTSLYHSNHPSIFKIMGRTNIHSSSQLLRYAGSDFDQIAHIPYADKLVYIHSTTLNQADLEIYVTLLRSGILGSWVGTDAAGRVVYCQPDVPHSIPKVVISAGLQHQRQESGIGNISTDDLGPAQEELAYVLISQGKSGNVRGKVAIEPSWERAATLAMYEVLNGYSVVFTAAMLKRDVDRLHDETYKLRAVGERSALRTISADDTERIIGLWCDEISYLD